MNYSDYADKGQAQVMTLLKERLSAKQWREADELTKIIMLKISNNKDGSYLSLNIDSFPGDVIEEIDELWQDHSNYHFGFSAQKKKFRAKNYPDFISEIGWYKGDSWLSYSNLSFAETAPKGHLPYCGWHFWQAVYTGSSSSHQTHNWHSHQPHYHPIHRPNQHSNDSAGAASVAAMGAAAMAAAPWLIGAAAVGGAGYLIYREATKGERKRKERLEKEEQERQEKQRQLEAEKIRLEAENRVQKNIESLLALV